MFRGRDDEVNAICEHIEGEGREPFVIWGESGCGKTALMAKAFTKVVFNMCVSKRISMLD